jgi:hypothetical protein
LRTSAWCSFETWRVFIYKNNKVWQNVNFFMQLESLSSHATIVSSHWFSSVMEFLFLLLLCHSSSISLYLSAFNDQLKSIVTTLFTL